MAEREINPGLKQALELGPPLLFFAVYGLIAAVFVALVVNHWLNWLDHRRRLAEEQFMQAPRQGD